MLGNVGAAGTDPVRVTEAVDCALLVRLAAVITRATDAFEAYASVHQLGIALQRASEDEALRRAG